MHNRLWFLQTVELNCSGITSSLKIHFHNVIFCINGSLLISLFPNLLTASIVGDFMTLKVLSNMCHVV